MLRSKISWFLVPLLNALLTPVLPVLAQIRVDLALVLAVDVSSSMDQEEQILQKQGYVDAFRSPTIQGAIRDGLFGQIAVLYMDWSNAFDQRVVVHWTVIRDANQAAFFAQRLARDPPRRASGGTSLSAAIDTGRHLLSSAPFVASREVIDISGDGTNNHGRPVAQARDAALLQGITINGLAIMLNPPDGPLDLWNVDRYYRDCVIGGPGALMIPVRERNQFIDSISAKIIGEIANWPTPYRIETVQADVPMDRREGASNRSIL